MDKQTSDRLDQQDIMLQRIEKMTRRTYKMFLWTMISSLVVIVLPLIALAFVIPKFISTFSTTMNDLSGIPGIGF
jgi:type II secretory pathway component PulF